MNYVQTFKIPLDRVTPKGHLQSQAALECEGGETGNKK
jgi:hypothetical protein